MSDSVLPTFFLVGAARSGTSSFADWLAQHPDVFIPAIKEPAFYVDWPGRPTREEYAAYFAPGKRARAVGDASTAYLFAPEAAPAIRRECPNARILVVLRDPVTMAYSMWQFMRAVGSEELPFLEAIAPREQWRRRHDPRFRQSCVNWYGSYLYLARAAYSHQLRRYYRLFGRSAVLVLCFEEIIQDPLPALRLSYRHIGVDPDFEPETVARNAGGATRWQFLKRALNRPHPLLRKALPAQIRGRLRLTLRDLNIDSRRRELMPPETRALLERRFRGEKERVFALVGRRFPGW